MYYGRPIEQYNLGRIVAPPTSGSDQSPTYAPPRLFVSNAGAAGLAANAATRTNAIALGRSLQVNTGSPGTPGSSLTTVGAAGTAGKTGTSLAMRLPTGTVQNITPVNAITGSGGAAVAPTVVRKPAWLKPALFVAAGFVVGWMIFK